MRHVVIRGLLGKPLERHFFAIIPCAQIFYGQQRYTHFIVPHSCPFPFSTW